VPRLKDLGPEPLKSGLSFRMIPRLDSWVTTIELVNATGVLFAENDYGDHVSVRPVNGTMEDWIRLGKDSIWTQTLIAICIKMPKKIPQN